MVESRREADVHVKYPFSRLFVDLWEYAEGYRSQLVFYFLVLVVASGIGVAPQYLVGLVIDSITQTSFENVPIYLCLIALSYGILIAARNWVVYKIKVLSSLIVSQTKIKTLQHLFSLDFAFYESTSLGTILARADHGAGSLHDLLRIFYGHMLTRLFSTLYSLLIILTLYPPAGIIAVLFTLGYCLFHMYSVRHQLQMEDKVFAEREKVYGKIYDFLRHIQIVKLLNIQDKLIATATKAYKTVVNIEKSRRAYERVKRVISGISIRFSETLVLGIVAYAAYQKFVTIGIAVAIYQYFSRANDNIDNIWNDFNELIPVRTALHRLSTIYEIKPTIIEPRHPKQIPQHWKSINFHHVSFKYPTKKHDATTDVTFSVHRGERVAIVGTTGSGKSTLAKLLLRLYEPDTGNVTLGGVDLSDIRSKNLFEKIKIVPQDNELINSSVFDNLFVAANGTITRTNAYSALRKAAADEFVKQLSEKIDTHVGPDGVKLSGGEKQRICLARALLTNPEILVLDEATSHLDVITERSVYEELRKLPKAVTIVAITHRISSVYLFDRVLVMNKGQLVGDGTHAELLKNNSYYKKLWKSAKKV